MDEKVIENLSQLEHEQWCMWASTVSKEFSSLLVIIDKLSEDSSKLSDEDKEIIDGIYDRLERWEKLFVPYYDLPESEKDKDRVFARKKLSLIHEEI